MTDSSLSPRTCPNCGARVSYNAHDCFMCGYVLDSRAARRLRVPLADLLLPLGLLALIAMWWRWDTRQQVLALTPTVTPTPTATSTPAPTATATATPTITPTATVTPTPVVYTVKSGDTLFGIAFDFGITAEELMAANGLTTDSILRISQTLVIPQPNQNALDAPIAVQTPMTGTLNYRVETGDTLAGLAIRFQVPVEVIAQTNNLTPTATLTAGAVLIIAMGPPSSAETVITPTPLLPYQPPLLVSPHDGSEFVGEPGALLRWITAGILPADVWYEVGVTYADSSLFEPEVLLTKAGSLRLDAALRPPDTAGSHEMLWWVRIVHVDAAGKRVALSQSSAVRRFTWR